MFLPITLTAFVTPTGNLPFNLCKIWTRIAIIMAGVRLHVEGTEKVVDGQSYVIISNHQSLYDIPALMNGLGMQFRWIIKRELMRIPLFGYALYASRNVFIDRLKTKQSLQNINRALDRLPGGVSVMFFAEGTRSAGKEIKKFKKGGFFMAVQRGLPILPITINGSAKVMPDKKSFAFYPGPIEVIVGDPIDTSDYSDSAINELVEKTRKAIISNFKPQYPDA